MPPTLHVQELKGRGHADDVTAAIARISGTFTCDALGRMPDAVKVRGHLREEREHRHVLVAYTPPMIEANITGVVICRTVRDGSCLIEWGVASDDPDEWAEAAEAFREFMCARWPSVHGRVASGALRARYGQIANARVSGIDVVCS